MKEEFIRFDSFIVKKNEIIYAELGDDEKSIILTVKDGTDTKKLRMNYRNSWDAEKCLNFLSVDTDAYTTDHWQHSLVKQVYFCRENTRECKNEMEKIKKELNSFR